MQSRANNWILINEVGGLEYLERIITHFYDRLFSDIFIGFFFHPHDKQKLIQSQIEYLRANLGQKDITYTGPAIRKAHINLPILPGHFDRRHIILKETLQEFDVPDHISQAWLDFDLSLRDLVVKTGQQARESRIKT